MFGPVFLPKSVADVVGSTAACAGPTLGRGACSAAVHSSVRSSCEGPYASLLRSAVKPFDGLPVISVRARTEKLCGGPLGEFGRSRRDVHSAGHRLRLAVDPTADTSDLIKAYK